MVNDAYRGWQPPSCRQVVKCSWNQLGEAKAMVYIDVGGGDPWWYLQPPPSSSEPLWMVGNHQGLGSQAPVTWVCTPFGWTNPQFDVIKMIDQLTTNGLVDSWQIDVEVSGDYWVTAWVGCCMAAELKSITWIPRYLLYVASQRLAYRVTMWNSRLFVYVWFLSRITKAHRTNLCYD